MTEETSTLTDGQTPEDTHTVSVQEAQLPEVKPGIVPAQPGQIEILLDASMTVTVVLGEADLSVRDLLQIGPGSVLRLNRQKGQPVDVYLRGVKFATGHLVVVGEQLGVRIHSLLAVDKGVAEE